MNEDLKLLVGGYDESTVIGVYLFGSSLSNASPRDVDLLVVICDDWRWNAHAVRLCIDQLRHQVFSATGLPADIIALTKSETEEVQILSLMKINIPLKFIPA